MKNHQAKILVAGDVMLDTYIYGKVERVSPEAPVPVLRKKPVSAKYVLGGAANVAFNIVTAGIADVDILSVVGEDEQGKLLLHKLAEAGIDTDMILTDQGRPTMDKLRYIGQNNQQLLRVDNESLKPVERKQILAVCEQLERKIKTYDIILLSDYLKGFLNMDTMKMIMEMAEEHQVPVVADIKDRNYYKYKGAYLLKPNQNELHEITGMLVSSEEEIVKASCFLCREAESRYVLTTLGADGMILTDRERKLLKVKSTAREIYDVTGAGDTAMAYLAAGLALGQPVEEAVETANAAAGVQVSKLGTSTVYPNEVFQSMHEVSGRNKQLSDYRMGGLEPIKAEQKKGRRIVFTNGCFDILHAGHVEYLQKAKELGDCLVVGINSDASVRRLKGNTRPVNGIKDRMLLLAALESVDYVAVFEEDTPLELIRAVMPQVLVKGGDYKIEEIVGADLVAANGGEVVTIPFVEGKSTTKMIESIQEKMV